MLARPRQAVAVLTRVPVGDAGPVTASAAPWFPVVGAATGAVVAAVLLAGGRLWPPLVAAVLAVGVEVLLTGALHLDGLADCADATGGRDRGHRLRIMKDHAIGAYGAVALVLVLGLRATCLAALVAAPAALVAGALVAGWAASRAALLLPALALPYPRAAGTGQVVVDGLTTALALRGLAGAVLLVAVGGVAAASVVPAARTVTAVLAAAAAVLLATLGVTGWARSRLGGATGDVLGATAELALLAWLLPMLTLA